jgi:hypothetical protein
MRLPYGDILGGLGSLAQGLFLTAQGSRACFVAGTPLRTGDGSKAIEEFKSYEEVGDECDYVLSRNEFDPNGPLELKRVLRKFVRVSPVLNLHVGGRIIGTTGEHPFFVLEKGWLPAGALQIGDLLQMHDGNWLPVEGVADSGRVETVYNLEVEDCHTYFVGEVEWGWSVWSHNATYRATDSAEGRNGWDLLFGKKGDFADAIAARDAELARIANSTARVTL